jgi:hypothetical protein
MTKRLLFTTRPVAAAVPAVVMGMLLSACSNGGPPRTDGPGAGGLEGGTDAIVNAPVSASFDGTLIQFSSGEIAYYQASAQTKLAAQYLGQMTTDDRSLTLFFQGKGAGTFACGTDAAAVEIGLTYDTSEGSYASTSSASLTPCQIVVSEYGAVGNSVTGTFAGTVFANSTLGGAPQQVRITSGTFDVTRLPDQ